MSLEHLLFSGAGPLARTLVLGAGAYIALIALLRMSGKRTLAKLSAFDLVVTVALGSTLSSALMSTDVSLTRAVLGLALLVALQFAVAWLGVRSKALREAVDSRPTLLLYAGEMRREAMRAQRITEPQLMNAVRSAGHARLEDVGAVVLETDGKLSVVGTPPSRSASALADVEGMDAVDGPA